jgi:multicomponent Na+:H+ antiporter subunit D
MILSTPLLPVDALSFLMLVLVLCLFPLVFIYSLAYVKRNLFRYYFVLLTTFVGMIGTVLSRDLLSFYVFLEIMTVGIYFLIIDNAKKESFPAGFKYVLMMFTGGIFILVASLMLFSLCGTFELSEIARLAPSLPVSILSVIFTIFIVGCLLEIGAVPLHVWLPEAHPVAPSPISALLSGLAIKIGAYAIIRLTLVLNMVNSLLIWIGVVSMVFGVVLALRQTNIKRLLAYSSISQMGYVLLGIGIGTGLGMAGALFHVINHATFKMLLFLCTGAIIFATRERELSRLGGMAKRMPITLATFVFAALAISGVPPFNGFASKAIISQAVDNGFLKFIIMLTAAGTIALFLKLFRFTFLGDPPKKLRKVKEVPSLMLFSMILLALACLGIGLFSGEILTKLIAPATGVAVSFNFWSYKTLLDAGLVVGLGIAIYFLSVKFGWLKRSQKGESVAWSRYLSLNEITNLLSLGFYRACLGLKKLLARDLNAHLLWVFLALISLLFIWRFVIL